MLCICHFEKVRNSFKTIRLLSFSSARSCKLRNMRPKLYDYRASYEDGYVESCTEKTKNIKVVLVTQKFRRLVRSRLLLKMMTAM